MKATRRVLACIVFGWVLAATGFFWATEAKADAGTDYAANNAAAICITLDSFPSFAGIEGIAQSIVSDGYLSYFDAGRAIRVSVDYVCPEHRGLVNAYSARYAPQSRGYVA